MQIFSPNPLMRINLSILEDNLGSLLCEKLFELLECQYRLKNVKLKL